jgi:uncharacterized MAPEG superfamily protein
METPIPVELQVLGLAALLQVLQMVLMAIFVNLQLGVRYTAGSRDDPKTPTGTAGRLMRAYNNHFEALVLFTIAVLVIVIGDRSNPTTEACAWVYLVARLLYVPAYLSEIFMLRSAVWAVSFLATIVLLIHGLF